MQSPNTDALDYALLEFAKKQIKITKDAVNPAFKVNGKSSKYADLASIMEILNPVLTSLDLIIYHTSESDYNISTTKEITVVTKEPERDNYGKLKPHSVTTTEVIMGLTTIRTYIKHVPSGQYRTSESPAILKAPSMQDQGSCYSYARRYNILNLLNLTPEGEDDDGNKASGRDVDTTKLNNTSTTTSTKSAVKGATPTTKSLLPTNYDVIKLLASKYDIPTDLIKGKVTALGVPSASLTREQLAGLFVDQLSNAEKDAILLKDLDLKLVIQKLKSLPKNEVNGLKAEETALDDVSSILE